MKFSRCNNNETDYFVIHPELYPKEEDETAKDQGNTSKGIQSRKSIEQSTEGNVEKRENKNDVTASENSTGKKDEHKNQKEEQKNQQNRKKRYKSRGRSTEKQQADQREDHSKIEEPTCDKTPAKEKEGSNSKSQNSKKQDKEYAKPWVEASFGKQKANPEKQRGN
ncbi:uncharacterized protein LOC132639564 [Lycium barbarum]|uniref:uncharacterized protein LOC132639564 n=1 Tax=Lycium barbarum TaxID=112863 RepID=UPI00293E080D|nr:uncharacterized protein LOC132639564 [Lycium barbarum]